MIELLAVCHDPAREVLYQLQLVNIFGRGVRPSSGAIKKFIHYQWRYQERYSFFIKTFAYSVDLLQFGHARGD